MEIIQEITDYEITGKKLLSTAAPVFSARTVLLDSDFKVAVMHLEKKNAYMLPGGGLEPGENLSEGLKREVMEETGCEITVIKELGIILENRAQQDFTRMNYYYLTEVKGPKGAPMLTESETADGCHVLWLPFDQCCMLIKTQAAEYYHTKFIKERDCAVLEYVKNSGASLHCL